MCLYAFPFELADAVMHYAYQYVKWNYIHIGVGFEVAYLSELGRFDGLEREISSRYGLHAFLYIDRTQQLKTNIFAGGRKKKKAIAYLHYGCIAYAQPHRNPSRID